MIVQAEQMKGMVAELVSLVEGRHKTAAAQGASEPQPAVVAKGGAASPRKVAAPGKASPTPDQMIPLDDEGAFSDF